jgi:L-asparaginase
MKKVLIIYTGGTIGMAAEEKTGKLAPLNFKNLLKELPELNQFDFSVDTISTDLIVDSSNANPKLWEEIIEIIRTQYNHYNGFVVLHGTDTMAFTACALSFGLQNLNKPVVITGSQLPLRVIRTDGKENLISAIEIAGTADFLHEVAIYFEYELLRGNRAQKVSSSHFDAFKSPNYPALAESGIKIVYDRSKIHKNTQELRFDSSFSNKILVLTLYPGIDLSKWHKIIVDSGVKVVIIRSFGSGNAPTSDEHFFAMLAYCQDQEIVVLNTSQCPEGAVSAPSYETGLWQTKFEVVPGADLTFEAAVVKSMFLAEKFKGNALKEALKSPIAGELSI